jgi:toxin ParE1/3/4
MGLRLKWSLTAQRDFDDITAFVGDNNPEAAYRLAEDLVARIRRLKEFPEMGSMVPEFKDRSLRQIIHRSYRIIYRFPDSRTELVIVRLWHGARGTLQLK